ncbi:MAG: hypothetical protein HGA31_00670 [Candidatus Moranbacteria bacterium]|nr:hypothetical protein [Candidatus Moranbacteria bacterium]
MGVFYIPVLHSFPNTFQELPLHVGDRMIGDDDRDEILERHEKQAISGHQQDWSASPTLHIFFPMLK